jgi:uncharacterized membrane protein YcaP (DUF421 family)
VPWLVGFRLGERRTLAELAAFDFVAVISVGAIIGRTATAADSAFLPGAIALASILLTHRSQIVMDRSFAQRYSDPD